MGGLFSHYQQKAQKQYSSNPANFAVGQNKVWEELSSTEKASSLFQEYGKKTADFSKEVGKGIVKAATETAVVIGDVAQRISPAENIRNTTAGLREVAKNQPGVPQDIAYQKGFQEDKARPLMLEKLTGDSLKNEDGTVNWDFARKFVGRSMEAPTYVYAGGVKAAELAGKGLLSRIVTRTASTLPEAGINTALQTGQEGTTENLGANFLANALLMSGVSNVVGEIRLPKDILNKTVSDIEGQVGKLTPEQKVDVQDALKQGVKSEEILTNLEKVKNNTVTPEEVAEIVNRNITPKESLDATSVASYIDKSGVKVTTRLSKRELEILADEIRTIPVAKDGNSQIHLDAETPVLQDAVKDGTAREVSRDEFISGHPQAKEVFEKTTQDTEPPKLEPTPVIKDVEAPSTVKVPQSQMPVGTGKEKVSRLEARMTGNLGKLTPEQIDELGLSTYNQMNKADQIKSAAEYVTENPDDGIKILSGEMEPPKGILKNSIYVAMENAAHDDAGLARRLASLGSTRAGQELSILTEALEDSPVKSMREVSDARIQATEKRLKSGSVTKTRNEITGTAKKVVEKTVTKAIKEDWNSFVDAIKCNS